MHRAQLALLESNYCRLDHRDGLSGHSDAGWFQSDGLGPAVADGDIRLLLDGTGVASEAIVGRRLDVAELRRRGWRYDNRLGLGPPAGPGADIWSRTRLAKVRRVVAGASASGGRDGRASRWWWRRPTCGGGWRGPALVKSAYCGPLLGFRRDGSEVAVLVGPGQTIGERHLQGRTLPA